MAGICHVALTSVIIFITLLSFSDVALSDSEKEGKYGKLLVVTVATKETDAFRRYMDSAEAFGINVKVVGMDQEWKGGDIEHGPGGGFKINLLREAVAQYKDDEDLVIMFTDSYDVLFLADADEMLRKFKAYQINLLFSAETYIWPEKSLANKYPKVENGYPYLCSGLYMGYAPYIYKALSYKPIEDIADDQLFFTELYLAERHKWNIKLDNPAVIFQNINGARADITLRFEGGNNLLHNTKYNTVPCVLHGNGPTKVYLNHLGNYLPNKWTFDGGCQNCDLDTFDLQGLPVEDYPSVVIAIFVGVPTPFFAEFLDLLTKLNYPKNKIDIFIHNRAMFHYHMLEKFREEKGPLYNSIKIILPAEMLGDAKGRNRGVDHCMSMECDYYFSVDSDVQLTNPDVLRLLMETNKQIVAPVVSKRGKLWSNFWGDLNSQGYYARSEDYVDLVRRNRRGVWNVPYINNVYLAKGEMVKTYKPNFEIEDLDTDMAICMDLRSKGIFLYVVNMEDSYGHIVTLDNYETTHLHNDMWELWNNKEDWEAKYLSPDYFVVKEMDRNNITMPCTDVYTFPLMSRTWAKELIEEMEHFGEWSGGGNQDKRLNGGYENVPTRDIHMNQIGFEQHWLYFLREYVVPICENVYPGYYSKAYAIMNFVVRYKPDEQASLRPHHDSSTYTINVALNERETDYEGGGARFIRYNCSVVGLPVGYSIMHPGRLTHYHEGLPTTNGTRYIMVSFIDP
ncbi:procollagen-lysine,2-oxoglutarate 5-dioxygenase 1 isoform X1 [Strongylocentrotus purpuratus]|uniref:procollagen-lysine 5-dioxygenase n=1 Tax=Strongylocentrotus purpuratus TaxID=7668 RepID=A0A7M7NWJ5_STRPU|nr:procollagen-lysine,2-oxoglutarate 5-dioxygenase 1 isoform X1 [Strongylocentrotus purpuratus]